MENTQKLTNLGYLQKASGGNKAFVKEMIEIFLRQTPQFLEELENYGKEQNWVEFRKIMHKLKPTIMMMGIQLEETIKQIEKSSKELQDLEKLPEALNELKEVCESSFAELKTELKNY